MKYFRTTAAAAASGALLGAALVPSSTASATARTTHRADGQRSLATVLAADGNHFDHNWSDFDVLDRAVHTVLRAKPHSPVAVLADGSKRLTAFLPTDRAFRRFVFQLTGHRPATEKRTFEQIAKLVDVNALEKVLLYHVVPGSTITYRQATKADGARLDTAAGLPLRVAVRHAAVRLVDRDPDARNARVIRQDANINRGNRQIAHGISQVLRPANLP